MDGLVAAVDALDALVRGSYGPSSDHVLVFAPPDPPLVTGDGHAVLRARRQQQHHHPVDTDAAGSVPFERVILDAAEGVYRETGDGTTQFVLLLRSVVTHIARDSHARGGARHDMAQRVLMARALGMVRHQWDTTALLPRDVACHVVVEERIEMAPATSSARTLSPTTHRRIEQVLTTALTGVLGERIVPPLVDLVMQWVFSSIPSHPSRPSSPSHATRCLYRHLQRFLQQAPRAIVHSLGGSFGASHVVNENEFVIRKSLLPSQLPSMINAVTPLRFVCVTGNMDLCVGSNQIVYDSPRHADACSALDGVRLRVVQFLTELRSVHDVRLLVTTEKVDDYIAATCTHLEIACVQYAETEDVDALCTIAGVCPLASVVDAIEDDRHIGVCAHGASVVRHAQTTSIRLRGLRSKRPQNATPVIPQLLVYASSKGVFKQYYNAILKTLRVLRCLFVDHSDSQPSLRLCRGAGATELAIAKAIQRDVQRRNREGCADTTLQLAMASLSTALVESVARLRTNLTQGGGMRDRSSASRQSRRVLLDEMSRLSCAEDEGKPHGYVLDVGHSISTTLGSIRIPTLVEGDPLDYHVVHPWHRTETIVHAVLQTAETLLRIDAVVFVKRNPALQKTGLHEASEHDDQN